MKHSIPAPCGFQSKADNFSRAIPHPAERSAHKRAYSRAWVSLLAACTLPASAADVSSTWNGGTANWSDAVNWTPNTFYPNNGNGGFTFDALAGSFSVKTDTGTFCVRAAAR